MHECRTHAVLRLSTNFEPASEMSWRQAYKASRNEEQLGVISDLAFAIEVPTDIVECMRQLMSDYTPCPTTAREISSQQTVALALFWQPTRTSAIDRYSRREHCGAQQCSEQTDLACT